MNESQQNQPADQCTGCQYEIEHEGKKVCRTMTRTLGQPCDAFKERKQ